MLRAAVFLLALLAIVSRPVQAVYFPTSSSYRCIHVGSSTRYLYASSTYGALSYSSSCSSTSTSTTERRKQWQVTSYTGSSSPSSSYVRLCVYNRYYGRYLGDDGGTLESSFSTCTGNAVWRYDSSGCFRNDNTLNYITATAGLSYSSTYCADITSTSGSTGYYTPVPYSGGYSPPSKKSKSSTTSIVVSFFVFFAIVVAIAVVIGWCRRRNAARRYNNNNNNGARYNQYQQPMVGNQAYANQAQPAQTYGGGHAPPQQPLVVGETGGYAGPANPDPNGYPPAAPYGQQQQPMAYGQQQQPTGGGAPPPSMAYGAAPPPMAYGPSPTNGAYGPPPQSYGAGPLPTNQNPNPNSGY